MNTNENIRFANYVLEPLIENKEQQLYLHDFNSHIVRTDESMMLPHNNAYDRQFFVLKPKAMDEFLEESDPTRQRINNTEQALPDRRLIDKLIYPTRTIGLPTRLDRNIFRNNC